MKKEHLVWMPRAYLPLLTNIQPFEDGERFFLVFAPIENTARTS